MNLNVVYALGAAALFGASTPLAKLLGLNLSPILLAGLLYLAFQLWRAAPGAEAESTAPAAGLMQLARQEFLVAAGNPKAILIFTAFLPQFVDPSQPVTPQFAVLGALFLMLEWIAIGAYAYMGLHMRRWFAKPRGKRIFNRCCAGLLSAAASVLLMARRA